MCVMRLRLLFGDRACVMCKRELDRVVITDDKSKTYASYQIYGDHAAGMVFDEPAGAFFKDPDHHAEVAELRQATCCEGSCAAQNKRFANVGFLDKHLRRDHKLVVCMLCADAKRMWPAELPRFTPKELEKHKKEGDPATGFEGHPMCKFCNTRFFSDSDLYKHLRTDHYVCDLCPPSSANQYYKDYAALEKHFKNRHFLCPEAECRQSRHVVFRTELDLQGHKAAVSRRRQRRDPKK